jgi:hypothetical protein
MTTMQRPSTGAIETELDELYRDREHLLRATPCPARSHLIADMFDQEAWLWSTLFETTRSRLMWRAALVAQAHARASARSWRRHAASQPIVSAHQVGAA